MCGERRPCKRRILGGMTRTDEGHQIYGRVEEEVLVVGLVLDVANGGLRREHRMRMVPADHLHLPRLDRLAHLHLGERVELHVHRARVGRYGSAREGLAQMLCARCGVTTRRQ